MLMKIIRNDMRKSKLITAVVAAFILLAALLTSLAASLLATLVGAIDNMMLQAKTPHYMQMHSGDIDTARLREFAAAQGNVQALQVLEFLNLEGADILVGENTLAGSVQDNGLAVQSGRFDFLLDLENNIIHPAKGEIYVPVYYLREGLAAVGDTVVIHGVSLTVAGFLRDSQMNSSFVGSKRFLVNEADFEAVREYGRLEYLIEFRLHDSSATSRLQAEYLDAGLPANGPSAITHSLFRLVNAINDGIVAAVLVLVSLLVVIVTFLCIRFTQLAKVEEDYREIGVLKAIGLRVSHIKRLYLAKYGVIALAAGALGFLVSLLLQGPLTQDIRLYMGEGGNRFFGALLGALGAALIVLVVVLYVAVAVTVLLSFLVTVLFMKMLVAKDRYTIAVLKSLGFTAAGIRRQYVTRSAIVLALGVVVGTVLANTLGEGIGVALIAAFGATSFHFVINPVFAYLLAPLLMAGCVVAATLLGISEIRTLKVSEHIKE